MKLNTIGSYSGIDSSTIDKLMEAHRVPLNQLNVKKSNALDIQNAWEDINMRLSGLYGKLKELQSPDIYSSMVAKSSNSDFVSMFLSKNAGEGVYRVSIQQLATNHSVIGGKALEEGFEGNGFFKITNNEGEIIQIDVSNGETLEEIAKKINESLTQASGVEGQPDYIPSKSIGIKASVIDGRLVLKDGKTGEREIKFTDDGENTLSQLGLNEGSKIEILGNNAIFDINGVSVERSVNVVDDVIGGITLNLNKAHEIGKYDTITIEKDTQKTTQAIKAFVDQYNSVMNFIEEKMAAGDPDTPGSRGILAGDSSLFRLHNSLRNMTMSPIKGENTNITNISQLGINTSGKSSKLSFDIEKLESELIKNIDNVKNFFIDASSKATDFTSKISDYIEGFVSKESGIIKYKNESYEKTIKNLNKQIERFEIRMDKKKEQYIDTFSKLDVAMMRAESQMDWLFAQMDALNGMKR